MNLGLVLGMAAAGFGDRVAITAGDASVSYADLSARSWAASASFHERAVPSVVYLGTNHLAYPVALFGAAGAGIPFVPVNYRLGDDQLAAQLDEHPGALVIHEGEPRPFADPDRWVPRQAFYDSLAGRDAPEPAEQDPDVTCLLLYTSGTTSAPKAAVLRHRHLVSYLFSACEFGSAGEEEAALVAVPPYHIAGVANLLSNLYAGRRIVYLDRFDPGLWLSTVREEQVTQAMVIPTMLARIVDHLGGASDAGTPTLTSLSYGGSRMPPPVLHRALELFGTTGFVNAYGLTETSSTIALLGPEDHRAALDSDDPAVRPAWARWAACCRGSSSRCATRPARRSRPGAAACCSCAATQISGEYAGVSLLDDDGWFPTRDRGHVDEEGYLFVEGRADDTIIRGGENIAPAEIEDVLMDHAGVVDAVVVGLPDDEWGQRLVGVVVRGEDGGVGEDELRELVRARLRSSKTPEHIEFWDELPRTDTGKLLRRTVVARLGTEGTAAPD